MSTTSAIAIYFIMWWVVLFTVLPFGVRNYSDTDEKQIPGQAPSAPLKPQLLKKFLITTVISAAFFALFYWVISSGRFSLDDIPFLPTFDEYSVK